MTSSRLGAASAVCFSGIPLGFRTFLAVGRRSAVAAGEFSELLSRPADRRSAVAGGELSEPSPGADR